MRDMGRELFGIGRSRPGHVVVTASVPHAGEGRGGDSGLTSCALLSPLEADPSREPNGNARQLGHEEIDPSKIRGWD